MMMSSGATKQKKQMISVRRTDGHSIRSDRLHVIDRRTNTFNTHEKGQLD
jgi:hypothetical protein